MLDKNVTRQETTSMSRRLWHSPPIVEDPFNAKSGGVKTKPIPVRHEGRKIESVFWKQLTEKEQKKEAEKQTQLYRERPETKTLAFRYKETQRPKTWMYGLAKPPRSKRQRAPQTQELYLPVVRYSGLYYSDGKDKKQKFCGRFYYVEPSSTTLLHLGETLVAASKVHATYALLHLLVRRHSVSDLVRARGRRRRDPDLKKLLDGALDAALERYQPRSDYIPNLSEHVAEFRQQQQKRMATEYETMYNVLESNARAGNKNDVVIQVYRLRKPIGWTRATVVSYTDRFDELKQSIKVRYLDTGQTEQLSMDNEFHMNRVQLWDPIAHWLFDQLRVRVPRLLNDLKQHDGHDMVKRVLSLEMWRQEVVPFFLTVLPDKHADRTIPRIDPATALYPCDITPEQKLALAKAGVWSIAFASMDFLDQPICIIARWLGIDTIVFQKEQGEYRAVSEVLDTRPTSFDYLVRAALPHRPVPLQVAKPLLSVSSAKAKTIAHRASDLERYTVKQLQEMARRQKVSVYSKLRKVQLIQRLVKAPASQTAVPTVTLNPPHLQVQTKSTDVKEKPNPVIQEQPWFTPQVPNCPTVWFPSDGFLAPIKNKNRIFKGSASNLAAEWTRVPVPPAVIAAFPYPPS